VTVKAMAEALDTALIEAAIQKAIAAGACAASPMYPSATPPHDIDLARSIGDLQDIVRELRAKGVKLKATEQPIDTSTPAGKAFLDMLGVFAEFETNLRRERQMEGIAAAKAKESWARESGQVDKWIFCLTTARLAEDQEIR
jgi:hypothetical protein